MSRITKAVFPVAGMGTRFLPATKASPKEMLPIVDKPLIQYAVEEAIEAGITELIFVTGRSKRAIEDHFDKAYEVETTLASKGKTKLLEQIQDILPSEVTCIYTRQSEALGLGHAILCARAVIGESPFAVVLADDLIDASPSVLSQMIEHYAHYHSSIIGVQNVASNETDQYGIVQSQVIQDRMHRVVNIVEKPKPDVAPSTLGVVGRYILTPRIFEELETVSSGVGNEIQLTDAIAKLVNREMVLAYEFYGKRYDCGSKIGYLKATVDYAMKHPDLADEFSLWLDERTRQE
ncbi:MAG: UTP--glucose-1-phosphate uridylyltransferase GalU [Proteobacteria bacterium]|nr:UTP--glucose-1-phosphate uridylyltransferase GalU [Pseudomonadota bacterium]MDE3208771.1 UTP--glucose-1-phosphate uridylyltransferase GalU [Pseudomonadota bacterium]